MKWTIIDQPWPASVLHMVPVGDVIEGITSKGALIGFRWNGATLPLASTALPLNAMAMDQEAADVLSTQFPEHLHLLRAQSPAIIRSLVNV
jgi:hypothetical protein